MQDVQHGGAEWKCSMVEEAHVQAVEGMGECGAADAPVCSAMRGRACGASAGSEVRAGCAAVHLHRCLLEKVFF